MALLTGILSSMSLLTGTALVLSANHWMYAWLGLEINTLAVIPLIMMQHRPRRVEAAVKYLLTQAPASALLLFSALVSAQTTGLWETESLSPTLTITMSIAIATKLGLAPVHFWMPDVVQGVPLKIGLVLTTWQKIAPMVLLYQISEQISITPIMIMATLSVMVGGWGCLNQLQLRKFLAYSSIAHLGWIVMVVKFNPGLMMVAFFIYILVSTPVFLSLKELSTSFASQLPYLYAESPLFTLTSTLILLSLGGLPPFTGFLMKLLIAKELMDQGATTLAAIIMLLALLSLFAYIRLTYFMAMLSPPMNTLTASLWRMKPESSIMFITPIYIMTLLLLPIAPMIVLLS